MRGELGELWSMAHGSVVRDTPRADAPVGDLAAGDLRRFCDFFYKRTGVQFTAAKHEFVARHVLACIREAGETEFGRWFARIRLEGNEQLFEAAVARLMIHETYFFREDYQLDALVGDALPRLVAARGRDRPLRILSLPAATGEEPYSIAIWLTEHWPDLARHDVEITGADIDPAAVAAARAGEYGERSLARVPDALRQRYFERVGPRRSRLREDLRSVVEMRTANVCDAAQMRPLGTFDIVFCRNLLIYFDVLSARRAAETLYSALVPGGFLFLGHAESMSRISPIFTPVRVGGTHAYQRPGGAT